MALAIYKVEIDMGLEYDLGSVLEDSVQVNDDDVVEIDEAVRVTFTRARGEFEARTVISVEADSEEDAEDQAKEAVSASYEVEDFVSVRYCNAEVVEVVRDHLIFESSTSQLYSSNDGRLRLGDEDEKNGNRVFVLELDGVETFATHSRAMVDSYIAGYDLARANGPDVETQHLNG